MADNYKNNPYRQQVLHPSVENENGIAPQYCNINFDNAATTPPLKSVMEAVNGFAPYYASVHRGSGARADKSSEIYDSTRREILRFFSASEDFHTVIFTRSTTESINRLSDILSASARKTIITTQMEHHSNDLPWRRNFNVVKVRTDENGRLDLNDMEEKLKQHAGDVRLVAVSGASNVTGYLNDIKTIASMAHRHGSEIFIDGAQLAPHKALIMNPENSDKGIDYLAFSAHKMYAPFGMGALICRRDALLSAQPDMPGGGTVDVVTDDIVIWKGVPERYESGTPNLMGIIALDAAMKSLKSLNMGKIAQHEWMLTKYAYEKLSKIEKVTIYPKLLDEESNIGVITFNVKDIHHHILACRLAVQAGIDVRSGCFCAQPYVQKLLNISRTEIESYSSLPASLRPGMVRISFGMYNTTDEIDILSDFLNNID